MDRRDLLKGIAIAPFVGVITLHDGDSEYRVLRAVVDIDSQILRLVPKDQVKDFIRRELEAYVEAMAQALEESPA